MVKGMEEGPLHAIGSGPQEPTVDHSPSEISKAEDFDLSTESASTKERKIQRLKRD